MERINITIGPEKRPCEFENFKQNTILPDDYEIKGEVLSTRIEIKKRRSSSRKIQKRRTHMHVLLCVDNGGIGKRWIGWQKDG